MYVLIDDGKRDAPADGERHVEEGGDPREPEREACFPIARGNGLEAGAEVFRVDAPPQIITESHATVNASSRTPGHGPISWVNPKYRKKIWTRIGVLRMIST